MKLYYVNEEEYMLSCLNNLTFFSLYNFLHVNHTIFRNVNLPPVSISFTPF